MSLVARCHPAVGNGGAYGSHARRDVGEVGVAHLVAALEGKLCGKFPVLPAQVGIDGAGVSRYGRSQVNEVLDFRRSHVREEVAFGVIDLRCTGRAQSCPLVAVNGIVGIADARIAVG